MPAISEVLTGLIAKYGGNKAAIARKLGQNLSPQRLGQYARGKVSPKIDFYKRWKEVYGDDLEVLTGNKNETIVSHTAHTSGGNYVPAHVLDHYRNTAEHIMQENKNLWELVRELRAEARNTQKAK